MIEEIKLIFPENLVTEPILYRLGKDFSLVYSIKSADVTLHSGWIVLSLEGEGEEIERAIRDLEKKGVKVERDRDI